MLVDRQISMSIPQELMPFVQTAEMFLNPLSLFLTSNLRKIPMVAHQQWEPLCQMNKKVEEHFPLVGVEVEALVQVSALDWSENLVK